MADEVRTFDLTGISSRYRKILNSHGHSFEASVLKACDGRSVPMDFSHGSWFVRAANYPVSLNGQEYHVDGVLQLRSQWGGPERFVSLECKRPDPSVSDWCFARRTDADEQLLADLFRTDGGRMEASLVGIRRGYISDAEPVPVVHLGLEVKTGETGDGQGKALLKSVDQAIRGASGLATTTTFIVPAGQWALFLPVVVTTASLFVADRPLDDADLATGVIDDIPVRATRMVWLVQHVSSSLLPAVRPHTEPPDRWNNVDRRLRDLHRRAVLIMNVAGLADGLRVLANAGGDPIR